MEINMKKYLLPESGNFYKANLHCHSTYSDGKLTPAELKEFYKEHGYSIIAYTDHDIMIDHSDLADEDFLPLIGYEMEINEPANGRPNIGNFKTCHMCFITLDPENMKQVCWHRSKYLFGGAPSHRDEVKFYEEEPDYERVYSPEKINEMIKMGRDHGFFVTYNHPYWSLENYNDYTAYEGMNAMEICNGGCVVNGYDDYDPQSYDDMLRTGHRIYCLATDDNHNPPVNRGTKKYDSFAGWVTFKADKLEYRTITDALVKGNFYASQGPAITDLWYEDGMVHIKCSDAEKIYLNTARRRTECVWASEDKPLNEATFRVLPEDGYIRITVIDSHGKPANTNAYFTDEILENN